MTTNTQPITDAADELADNLSEGAAAAEALGVGIVDAIHSLDARITALEDGSETTPPVEPPTTTNTIPMSFNDPMFTGMTEKTSTMSLSNGQNLNKVSIKENSGNPTITSHGNNRITTCRVQSRECVRITSGVLTIENTYLEAHGSGDDHADVLQAYSPHSTGTVTLRNVHVRAFNEAATAGYFSADYWGGKIICDNVIFNQGPFGIRAIADAGSTVEVEMSNVFFVGPFHWDKFSFEQYDSGRMTITKWQNVRNATIENDKLVPGSVINKPGGDDVATMSAQAKPRPKPKDKK